MSKVILQIIVSALALVTGAAVPTPALSPDIVVYSGVPCGIAASITAAREGAKVVLVEPTKHVGGLSTSGINTAESEHMLNWGISADSLTGPMPAMSNAPASTRTTWTTPSACCTSWPKTPPFPPMCRRK
jgi:heterodisulfide reductase subunit A-like polyferredoxin